MSPSAALRRPSARVPLLIPLMALVAGACGDGTEPPQLQEISISAPIGEVVTASTELQLTAQATDTRGNPMEGLALEWASSMPSSASVTQQGVVTTHAAGTPRIEASWGAIIGGIDFTVVEIDRAALEGWLADPWTAALLEGLGASADVAAALDALDAGDILAVDEAPS